MSRGTLHQVWKKFEKRVKRAGLIDLEVSVEVKPLTLEEAIGDPTRRDYPIIIGKERVNEARVAGNRGHAFSDTVRNFEGKLGEVLELPLDNNGNRAIFIAVLNATLKHLDLLDETLHCRDDDPERCGAEIRRVLRERFANPKVGLIGLNPAIAEHLVDEFGSEQVSITDMNPNNIGKWRHGVEIWDGASALEQLVDASDVILLTGTTLVNSTFDTIWGQISARGRVGIVYGVTAAGVCHLMGYERLCPFARAM